MSAVLRPTQGFFNIARSDVDSGSVRGVVRRLHMLSDDPRLVQNLAQSTIISFSGYSGDRRPLHEIPAVRDFFLRISVYWPYWAHFVYLDRELVRMLALLGADITRYRSTSDPAWQSVGLNDLADVTATWMAGLESLHQRHGIPVRTTNRIWNEVEACLTNRSDITA